MAAKKKATTGKANQPRKKRVARKAKASKPTKLGRPSKRTPELDAVVQRALRLGMGLGKTADLIGVSEETLRRWRLADEAFEVAIKRARAEGILEAAGTLHSLRQEDRTLAATIYFLKTRGGEEWREVKHTDKVADAETLAVQLMAAATAMRASIQGPPASDKHEDGFA